MSSSLIWVVSDVVVCVNGVLAQLGEHLPYKQRVIGSSPIGPILYELNKFIWREAAVAELADARDLKSRG